MKTQGISPKVVADLAVTLLAFLLSAGVLALDPVTAAALSKFLGTVAAIIAPPGDVARKDGDG